MKHYGYVLVGSRLYTGVFAWYTRKNKRTCLVLEKRDHIEGNIYREDVGGTHVHRYGAHIFHTSNKEVWEFVNSLVEFSRYTNSPVANFKEEMYNMLFNMNTFSGMWGVPTPDKAKAVIEKQRAEIKEDPRNLEEQAISPVGRELYEKLIKGYMERQWDRDCREPPAFIIKHIPVRYTYDNDYFNDPYQGIPIDGYSVIMEKLSEGCDIETGVDYPEDREHYDSLGETVVYTGTIDVFHGYWFGKLEYRSLEFESQVLEEENRQGVAVVNYTDRETPYTRAIEYKHFEFGSQPKTVITREYPVSWQEGMEPYYPVDDQKNQKLFCRYEKLAKAEEHVWSGGHLGEYKYHDMNKVIGSAMRRAEEMFG